MLCMFALIISRGSLVPGLDVAFTRGDRACCQLPFSSLAGLDVRARPNRCRVRPASLLNLGRVSLHLGAYAATMCTLLPRLLAKTYPVGQAKHSKVLSSQFSAFRTYLGIHTFTRNSLASRRKFGRHSESKLICFHCRGAQTRPGITAPICPDDTGPAG